MRKEKTTEVFVETEVEIEVKGRTRRLNSVWCTDCGASVELVPPDVAALVLEVSARTVFGWVEAGCIHFTETPDGALLVCVNSIAKVLSADADGAGLSTEGPARALSSHENTAPKRALDGREVCDSLTEKGQTVGANRLKGGRHE